MTSLQLTFNFKKHIWSAPSEYKDLGDAQEIAIDLETKDEGINNGLGAGWATNQGEIIGFDRDENSDACELISSLTGDNSRQVVSFGTEAGLFQEIGISTAVCGPGSIEQAHKIDEYIELSELKKCLEFLKGVKDKSIN